MKKGLWIIPLILVIAASGAGYFSSLEAGYPQDGGIYSDPGVQQYSRSPQPYGRQGYGRNEDMSYFYDRLDPYGNWIYLNPFGYVWTPRHMGYRWRPYSDGYWVWTDYGWTWISDLEWGDIPFHYGRWGWDNDIGWFWVPGMVWGPAWVTWRSSDQYMGWAPLPPGVEFRFGMNFNSLSIDIPFNFWIFIQGSHFQDRYLNPYLLPFERNRTIVNFTTMHNNIYNRNDRIINEGIGLDVVRRITQRDVPKYILQDAQQPGPTRIVGQEIQIFRPAIRQNEAAKPKAFLNRDQARQELAPAKIFDPRTIDTEAAAARKRQIEEKNLLEMSQTQEMKNMQQKHDAEQAQIRDAAKKAKVQQDYQSKMGELEKQHQAEKQQLTERHKQDAEQVDKAKKEQVDKAKQEKQAPPGKKKKINQE